MADLGFGGFGSLAESAADFLTGPFDLFGGSKPETVSVVGRPMHFYPSSVNLNGPEIEFKISGASPNYLFMSSMALHVTAHIVREDGEDWTGAEFVVAPISLLGPSMFSAVDIEINSYQASELSTPLFPYKNFFDIMTTFGTDAQRTWLPMLGFYPDTAGRYDSVSNDAANGNKGYTDRRRVVNNGQKFEVIMPILCDFLRCETALPPNLNLKITFKPSNPRFYLNTGGGASLAANFKLRFDSLVLHAHFVEPSAGMLKAQAAQHVQKPIRMPIKKTVIKPFDIPVNTYETRITNIVDGFLPHMVLIGFVSSQALLFLKIWKTNILYIGPT